MATSVVAFSDVSILTNKTKAYIRALFTPPSNISGDHCYVECTFWSWDYGLAPTSAIKSNESLQLRASWSQTVAATVLSGDTSTQGTRPFVASASLMDNKFYSHGPVLCFIPDGPQEVEFTISRTDGGDIAGDTTSKNYCYMTFKIVNATSRQPTIGV